MTCDDEFLASLQFHARRVGSRLQKDTGITAEDLEELDWFRKSLGPYLSFADVANILIESDQATGPEVDAYRAAGKEYGELAVLASSCPASETQGTFFDHNPRSDDAQNLWRLGKARYHAALRVIAATTATG